MASGPLLAVTLASIIDIDPGMAFGTGQHPSTRMCLEALENILLHDRSINKWRVLDVGTGTGILGIAAAKLNDAAVLCVDTDKKAVEIATENVLINNVEKHVKIRHCEITILAETFDLIVANITAKALIKLRPHLQRLLDQGQIGAGVAEQGFTPIQGRTRQGLGQVAFARIGQFWGHFWGKAFWVFLFVNAR